MDQATAQRAHRVEAKALGRKRFDKEVPYLFDSAWLVLYRGATAGCGRQVKDGAKRLRKGRERGKGF